MESQISDIPVNILMDGVFSNAVEPHFGSVAPGGHNGYSLKKEEQTGLEFRKICKRPKFEYIADNFFPNTKEKLFEVQVHYLCLVQSKRL